MTRVRSLFLPTLGRAASAVFAEEILDRLPDLECGDLSPLFSTIDQEIPMPLTWREAIRKRRQVAALQKRTALRRDQLGGLLASLPCASAAAFSRLRWAIV